jgi:predicted DNA-binding transcriptional regulator AlpA
MWDTAREEFPNPFSTGTAWIEMEVEWLGAYDTLYV